MDNKLPQAKFIKRDAVVNITLGANIIEKITHILGYISKDISSDRVNKYHEELKHFNEILKNEKQFSEDWMNHVTTLSLILQEIDRQAEAQGQVIIGDIEDYLKNSVTEFLNSENTPPADQSQ